MSCVDVSPVLERVNDALDWISHYQPPQDYDRGEVPYDYSEYPEARMP